MSNVQTNLIGARVKQNSLLRHDTSHEVVAVFSFEENLWLIVRDEEDGSLRRHNFKDVTVTHSSDAFTIENH